LLNIDLFLLFHRTAFYEGVIMRASILTIVLFMICAVPFARTQNVYEVYAIEYGNAAGRTPATEVAIGASPNDSVSFAFFFWYLKGNNGKKILVDAGFVPDSAKPDRYPHEYERPDRALGRINVQADEITDIIITHPHVDHIGGVDLFKNATYWMQKNDYSYFIGDAWQPGANHIGLDKRDVMKIVRANLDGRLRLINGDSVEIMPGIRVFIGSRHTYESQHVLVNTKTDKVLVASDDCWYYYNLDHLLPITLLFDPDAYVRELRRMKTLVTDTRLIIPGHDALVLSRFPLVAKGVVKIR
jgi:glyoxylase-like metal-dependent hydrolase (beta-lactamase superfamily II)